MAVTIYTSDDAGAPVLNGTNGSLINLLDKCLVEGYGSTAGLGWSKPNVSAQSASADANYANVVFQMRMRGLPGTATFTDDLGAVGTAFGNALLCDRARSGPCSAYFDGTGDYVRFPGVAAYALGTGDFTVEAWINTTDVNGSAVVDYWTTASATSWQMYVNASGQMAWYSASAAIKTGAVVVNDGQWHHVAFVRSANMLSLWVDGVADGAAVACSNDFSTTQTYLGIGAQVNVVNAAYDMLGHLQDVRITKGVARYVAPFTPDVIPVPVQYTQTAAYKMPAGTSECLLRVQDYDTYASVTGYASMSDVNTGAGAFPPVTGTQDWLHNYVGMHVPGTRISTNVPSAVNEMSGKAVMPFADAATSASQSKYYGTSMRFDGTGDFFQVDGINTPAGANEWNFGTGACSFEAWALVSAPTTSQTTKHATIMCLGYSGNIYDELYITGDTVTTGTGVTFNNNGTTHAVTQTLGAGWNHVAWGRTGTNHYIYINGVKVSSATNLGSTGLSPVNGNQWGFCMGGRNYAGLPYYLNGYLQDVRTTKGWARYGNANFVPPAAALPVESLYVQKSSTANSTARKWWMISNGTLFHLFIDHDGTSVSGPTTNCMQVITFGKYDSWVSTYADNKNCVLRAGWLRGLPDDRNGMVCSAHARHGQRGAWFSSTFDQQEPTPAGYVASVMAHTNGLPGNGAYTIQSAPSAYDGRYWFSPITLTDTIGLRGKLPGMWSPCHNMAFKHAQVVNGSGELAGRQFMCMSRVSDGQLMIEISNTW